jgi:hypothetical protein
MSDLAKELGEVVAALRPRCDPVTGIGYEARGEAMAARFLCKHHAALSALLAERDALLADAERLDWIAQRGGSIRSAIDGRQQLFRWGACFPHEGNGCLENLRRNVDFAMRKDTARQSALGAVGGG